MSTAALYIGQLQVTSSFFQHREEAMGGVWGSAPVEAPSSSSLPQNVATLAWFGGVPGYNGSREAKG